MTVKACRGWEPELGGGRSGLFLGFHVLFRMRLDSAFAHPRVVRVCLHAGLVRPVFVSVSAITFPAIFGWSGSTSPVSCSLFAARSLLLPGIS